VEVVHQKEITKKLKQKQKQKQKQKRRKAKNSTKPLFPFAGERTLGGVARGVRRREEEEVQGVGAALCRLQAD
jgi:hypothetical protein